MIYTGKTWFIKYLSQQYLFCRAKILNVYRFDIFNYILYSDREKNRIMAGYIFDIWIQNKKFIPALIADFLFRLR